MKWTAVILILLCGCTITVAPLKKKNLATHPVYRHHSASRKAIQEKLAPMKADEKVVSARWMLRYRIMERQYGEIDSDAKIQANFGTFVVNKEVLEHYREMNAKEENQ